MNRRPIVVVAALVAVAVGASVASAAWTQTASGRATAKSASMPTGPTPSAPATGTQTTAGITVTWPRVNHVGTTAEVLGYQVSRFKGGVADTIAGNCTGTITAPTRTCADTVTSSGVYTYTVKAVSGNWVGTAGTASGAVTVSLRTASLTLSVAGSKTAGTAFSLVFDTGTTLTGTNQAITVAGLGTSPAPTSAAPTKPTTANFVNGVATISVTDFKAEAATIQATQGTTSASTTPVTVQAAAPALLFSQACSAFNTQKGTGANGKTLVSITRGTDTYANPVTDPNAGVSKTVTLGAGSGAAGTWSPATLAATISNSFGSSTWQNSSGNPPAAQNPTASAPGYVSASCSYNTA